MSATVAHVPAPPPRRVVGRRVGGVSDGPLRTANDVAESNKRWEQEHSADNRLTANLLSDAALMRDRNQRLVVRSRKEAEEQQRIVYDNLQKKIKMLMTVRSKLSATERRLFKANEALVGSRTQAKSLIEKLEKPLQKCAARSLLRSKRPPAEKVADEVGHAVQTHAEGLSTFIQRLQTFVIGADQLQDENGRVLKALRDDIAAKSAAIEVEERCIVLKDATAAEIFESTSGDASIAGGNTPEGKTASLTAQDAIHHVGRNAQGTTLDWQHRTAMNLERAQQLTDQTTELTTKLNAYMAKVTAQQKDLNAQVKQALELKTSVTSKQEARLEENVARLEAEMDSLITQQANIAYDIEKRQEPLLVAKRRLDARRGRPGGENVRDAVEEELEKEFLLLASGIESLNIKSRQVDEQLRQIRIAHAKLRQAMLAKQLALSLDQQCLELDEVTQFAMTSRASSRGSARGGGSVSSRSGNGAVKPYNATAMAGAKATHNSASGSGSFLPPVTPRPISSRASSGRVDL